jgi:hypothetical protein
MILQRLAVVLNNPVLMFVDPRFVSSLFLSVFLPYIHGATPAAFDRKAELHGQRLNDYVFMYVIVSCVSIGVQTAQGDFLQVLYVPLASGFLSIESGIRDKRAQWGDIADALGHNDGSED